jgi:hypothetical protein
MCCCCMNACNAARGGVGSRRPSSSRHSITHGALRISHHQIQSRRSNVVAGDGLQRNQDPSSAVASLSESSCHWRQSRRPRRHRPHRVDVPSNSMNARSAALFTSGGLRAAIGPANSADVCEQLFGDRTRSVPAPWSLDPSTACRSIQVVTHPRPRFTLAHQGEAFGLSIAVARVSTHETCRPTIWSVPACSRASRPGPSGGRCASGLDSRCARLALLLHGSGRKDASGRTKGLAPR